MAAFTWEGTTQSGETRKGEMEANNARAVQDKLRAQGIQPTKVAKKGGFDWSKLNEIQFGTGISRRDIVVFTRQFATMIDAGLPLVQCLEILSTGGENPFFKKVLAQVKSDVESGMTFADALGRHPAIFDELFVNLVRAGEIGGILDTILARLAAYIEKNDKLVREVKGAMTYPAAIVVISIIIVIILLWKVIPTFAGMFKEMGGQLPLPTQIMITLSDVVVDNLIWIFLGLGGGGYGIFAFYNNPRGKRIVDRVAIRSPVIGDLIRKVAVAKFCRTMSTMVASGVPLLDGLAIVAKTAGNVVVEDALMFTRDKISEGKNIAEPMGQTKVFPPMVVQMIGVGEATGAMDTMMAKIADFYEDEVDQAVANMKALIEPIIISVLGVVLGSVVVAMYLPVFQMAATMK